MIGYNTPCNGREEYVILEIMAKNNKQKAIPQFNRKPSVPELILLGLEKLANAPFEILLEYGKIRNQMRPSATRMALHRLKKKALICAERRGKKILFMLTEDGEKEVQKIKSNLERAKPKKWDGKWRIIIFDIPEKLRGKRDLLRRELVGFGFKQLQESVWAYPYALPQEFRDLWEKTGIFKYCMILESDKIENGDWLQRHFFSK